MSFRIGFGCEASALKWANYSQKPKTSKPIPLPQPPTPSEPKKKGVSIYLGVRVVLIPTREEYKEAEARGEDNSPMTDEEGSPMSISQAIYWGEADYARFKQDAVAELKKHMRTHNIGSKEAIKSLYQPDADTR